MLREPVRRVRSRLARGLRAGAWFFAGFSLLHLAWVLAVLGTDPSGAVAMYGALDPSVGPTAPGLLYAGTSGLALAVVQTVVVVAGLGLTLTRVRRARRVGHLLLLAWAGLWTADMLGLAGALPGPESAGRAALMALLFACTLGRAAMGWTPAPRSLPTEISTEHDEPDADPLHASGSVAPEPTGRAGPGRLQAMARRTRGAVARVRSWPARFRSRQAVEETPAPDGWRTEAVRHGRAAAEAVGRGIRTGLQRSQELARAKGVLPAARTGSVR